MWRAKLEGDGIGSEIIALRDRLYLGGYAQNFYIIDALSGKQIKKSLFNYGIGNPLLGNGNIFFGTGRLVLYRVKRCLWFFLCPRRLYL